MTYPDQVIGLYNQIPWRLPEDLKWFRKNTINKTVIMGKNTYISIGGPLNNRQNIVLTHDLGYRSSYNIEIANSIDEAIKKSKHEIFIIGGETVYRKTIHLVQKMYITWIDCNIKGDAFFPKVDLSLWKRTYYKTHLMDDRNAYNLEFSIYENENLHR